MDCAHRAELFPWLINKTLEERPFEEHVPHCEKCKRELAETISAWTLYGQHVPANTLVEYAFEGTTGGMEHELVERHLTNCRECARELDLMRESQSLESHEALEIKQAVVAEKSRALRALPWQYVAIAASLIGVIAVGGWFLGWQEVRGLQATLEKQQGLMRERFAHLEKENQRLRQDESELRQQREQAGQQIAQLQEKVQELGSPQLNIPVLDLYPNGMTQRGTRTVENKIQFPPGAGSCTLILNTQSRAQYQSYSVEIEKLQTVVWRADGLVRQSGGDYTLSITPQLFSKGSYTLHVYGKDQGEWKKIESYLLRIQ